MINLNELVVSNVDASLEAGFFFVELEASCADCNEWAVVDGEWDHIELFLIEQARAVGVEIVG